MIGQPSHQFETALEFRYTVSQTLVCISKSKQLFKQHEQNKQQTTTKPLALMHYRVFIGTLNTPEVCMET